MSSIWFYFAIAVINFQFDVYNTGITFKSDRDNNTGKI